MEKNTKKQKYSIGLDIGTNSVGWSVTNEENKLINYRSGKPMWGVRLFESGQTAVERRGFRSSRRRMDRKKARIKLLQELLQADVLKKDKEFFVNLQLSKYYKDDYCIIEKQKRYRKEKYNLFNDVDFLDKEYYKEYYTIYHLRKKIIECDEKMDIRLVYLAMHHIIKYRGNFLYQGTEFSNTNIDEVSQKLKEIFKYLGELNECDFELEENIDIINIIKILKEQNLYKKQKEEKILELCKDMSPDIKKVIKNVIKFIIGYKVKLSDIFNVESTKSIRLTDDYDENEIEDILGGNIECFNNIKDVNSWYLLQDILKGSSKYISEAFVNKYEKYEKDLKLLKNVYKKYIHSEYFNMFRKSDAKNYKMYNESVSKCSYEDFLKIIKKDIEKIPDCNEKSEILDEIANETFLVKLRVRENGAIPYQLHKDELEKIIENQSKYYDTLKQNKDKILSILEFKIPYYVGPLKNDKNNKFSWSIRKEGEENTKVLPWNFTDVIDKVASAEEFIKRMLNKCQYIPTETVVPKNSLLYSEYCLLNEINNITIDGKRISKDTKEKLINELFKKYKTVKESKFKEFLIRNGYDNIKEIRGYQKEKEFASSLTSYIEFTNILGEINEKNYDMIEELINWITIFEDKEILRIKIDIANKEKYSNVLTKKQIEDICNKKYSGWSRLSKKLLVELKYIDSYQNKLSIMDILRKTEYNFMQIITDKDYGFKEKLEEYSVNINNKKINQEFYEENISTIACSPAIKRGIWQTIRIVDEIVKVMKCEPENIYIEFARSDEKSKRTDSRYKMLENAYKKLKDEFSYFLSDEVHKNLKQDIQNKKQLTEKLFLYYLQNGKSLYSNEKLDIDKLSGYQVDHIIPQSYLKDDSFENKALVLQGENQRKLDALTLDKSIIYSQKENWKKLKECGLMGDKKYFNLIRENDSEKLKEKFIQRQLVETRQITKHVANIFKNLYEEAQVYSIKAMLSSDFRSKYQILKNRDINDFHHAQDAYISSTLGYFINKRYPKMLREFKYDSYIKEYRNKLNDEDKDKTGKAEKNKFGFVVESFGYNYIDKETGEIIWDSKVELNKVLKSMNLKEFYITKKLEELTSEFYNQNAVSKEEALKKKNPIQIKENLDPLKYGSYDSEKIAYSVLIEYTKKDKKHMQVIGIPVLKSKIIGSDLNKLKEYIQKDLGYENVKILKNKILKNQLIIKEGKPYYIVSSGEIKISKQLKLKNEYVKKINDIFNEKDLQNIDENNIIEIYDILTGKIKKEYFESIGEKLETYREKMLTVDKETKIGIIKNLLFLTAGTSIDLIKIGGKSGQGRISKLNMTEKWLENVIFVEQSITGIYEKRYDVSELENNYNIKKM